MDAGKFFGGLLLLIVIYAVFMIVMGLIGQALGLPVPEGPMPGPGHITGC